MRFTTIALLLSSAVAVLATPIPRVDSSAPCEGDIAQRAEIDSAFIGESSADHEANVKRGPNFFDDVKKAAEAAGHLGRRPRHEATTAAANLKRGPNFFDDLKKAIGKIRRPRHEATTETANLKRDPNIFDDIAKAVQGGLRKAAEKAANNGRRDPNFLDDLKKAFGGHVGGLGRRGSGHAEDGDAEDENAEDGELIDTDAD